MRNILRLRFAAGMQDIQVSMVSASFMESMHKRSRESEASTLHAHHASSDSSQKSEHFTSRIRKNLRNQRRQERSHDVQPINSIGQRKICSKGKCIVAKRLCYRVDREDITQSQSELIFASNHRSNCNGDRSLS